MIILSKFGLQGTTKEPFCNIQKFSDKEKAKATFILELADLDGRLPNRQEDVTSEVWSELEERYGIYAEAGQYVDAGIDYVLRLFEPNEEDVHKYADFEENRVYDVSQLVSKEAIEMDLRDYR